MLKMIERFKPITLLLATLLMVIMALLPSYTEANQLLYDMEALKEAGSLAVKLQDPRAAVSNAIASQLSDRTQQLLAGYDGISEPSVELRKALLADLNRRIQAGPIYDAQIFADIELSEGAQALIAQNPQSGDALVRLNRMLLSAAYPYELASLSKQRTLKLPKGIEACRENLRQIKLALEKYRIANADTDLKRFSELSPEDMEKQMSLCRVANADTDPQWLFELSPEYLEKKMLLCPADATAGVPGVLTEGASDPTLPCSYLYEFRPSENPFLEILQFKEGNMLPIIRCEHHRLNLSVNGKLYQQGPQRTVYNSNVNEFSEMADFMQALRAEHGEAFIETPEGRKQIKEVTETLILKQFIPELLDGLEKKILADVKPQIEAQIGKGVLETEFGQSILAQVMPQVLEQHLAILDIDEKLRTQLKSQLGEEFFNTDGGQDILEQLSVLMSR